MLRADFAVFAAAAVDRPTVGEAPEVLMDRADKGSAVKKAELDNAGKEEGRGASKLSSEKGEA